MDRPGGVSEVDPSVPVVTLRLRSEDISWTEATDEIIVLNLRTSRYLSINRTGAALWLPLVEGASVEVLVKTLQDRFQVERTQAQADVAAFVDRLAAIGLLAEAG